MAGTLVCAVTDDDESEDVVALGAAYQANDWVFAWCSLMLSTA